MLLLMTILPLPLYLPNSLMCQISGVYCFLSRIMLVRRYWQFWRVEMIARTLKEFCVV